jgi:ferrochelatase
VIGHSTTEGANRTDRPNGNGRRRGVLLINLGTPDGPDPRSVRRYLAEFLGDPAVIQLPRGFGWFNRPLGHIIARARGSKSAALYRSIWTDRGSPLATITQDQSKALASILPPEWQTFYAMRYGQPSIGQVLREIEGAGIDELVVVPMYPQFSGTTTGTAVRELYSCLRRGGHHLSVAVRNNWHDDGGYVHAQAKLIEEYAHAHGLTPENSHLVFSAHGLPVSYVERGDPYPEHIAGTVKLVIERLGWPTERAAVGYQSRLGPARWLEPSLDGLLQGLAEAGEKRLLVCPISFTVDCLETLEEIDVRSRKVVEASGADLFLCPALNTFKPFITALKELTLRGPRPVSAWKDEVAPLFSDDRDERKVHRDTAALVMIGVSTAGGVEQGYGPRMTSSSEAGLAAVKRPQNEVVPLLRKVAEETGITEAFIWNTCARFEFYGWLPEADVEGWKEQAITGVKQRLFGPAEAEDLQANVRLGGEAWHHLMRTVCGLNSRLPGDKDILEQLETAQRVAERSGTAGRRTKRLIEDALALECDLRAHTEWGRFDPGYCYAAMARVADATDITLADCRCAVFGGSTTSRSVLTALANRFEVPSRTITLVYRGHGSGQMKLLRRAIGNGKRVRVQSYTEQAVADVVAKADVIVFGIDVEQPVLGAAQIRDRRDFKERPLTIIDFNTFGSTTGMETLEGVTVWHARQLDDEVVAYGETMCGDERFPAAVDEAEARIVEQALRRQCTVAVDPTPAICQACGRLLAGRCQGVAAQPVGEAAS